MLKLIQLQYYTKTYKCAALTKDMKYRPNPTCWYVFDVIHKQDYNMTGLKQCSILHRYQYSRNTIFYEVRGCITVDSTVPSMQNKFVTRVILLHKNYLIILKKKRKI